MLECALYIKCALSIENNFAPKCRQTSSRLSRIADTRTSYYTYPTIQFQRQELFVPPGPIIKATRPLAEKS
jgi:hypothetical protein